MRQLNLPFERDAISINSYLESATRKKISLIITDNAISMINFRPKGDIINLRLHRIFLSACDDTLDEIAAFIKNGKRNTPLIRNYINQNRHSLNQKITRKVFYHSEGKHYDLLEIFNAINKEYFNGCISASIAWGTRGPRVARNRTLGSYVSDDNIIRINPILDSRAVPRYFLEFIVYHEMLHADLLIGNNGGRRSLHSKEFKEREKMFRHYERAVAWEKRRW